MSDITILGLIVGLLGFALVVMAIIAISRIQWLEKDNRLNKADIWQLRQGATDVFYATSMGKNIKVNDVLWKLMSKCGYYMKMNINVNAFELEKTKEEGENYGEARERTKTVGGT